MQTHWVNPPGELCRANLTQQIWLLCQILPLCTLPLYISNTEDHLFMTERGAIIYLVSQIIHFCWPSPGISLKLNRWLNVALSSGQTVTQYNCFWQGAVCGFNILYDLVQHWRVVYNQKHGSPPKFVYQTRSPSEGQQMHTIWSTVFQSHYGYEQTICVQKSLNFCISTHSSQYYDDSITSLTNVHVRYCVSSIASHYCSSWTLATLPVPSYIPMRAVKIRAQNGSQTREFYYSAHLLTLNFVP